MRCGNLRACCRRRQPLAPGRPRSSTRFAQAQAALEQASAARLGPGAGGVANGVARGQAGCRATGAHHGKLLRVPGTAARRRSANWPASRACGPSIGAAAFRAPGAICRPSGRTAASRPNVSSPRAASCWIRPGAMTRSARQRGHRRTTDTARTHIGDGLTVRRLVRQGRRQIGAPARARPAPGGAARTAARAGRAIPRSAQARHG